MVIIFCESFVLKWILLVCILLLSLELSVGDIDDRFDFLVEIGEIIVLGVIILCEFIRFVVDFFLLFLFFLFFIVFDFDKRKVNIIYRLCFRC